MTDKQWPKCLRVYPHWEQSGNGFDQENCHIAEPWDLASRDDLSPKEAKYTRTDIAEARIAELEKRLTDATEALDAARIEINDANDQLARILPSESRLREDRDALQRRIDQAPTLTVEQIDQTLQFATSEVGKRVALVVLP